MDPAEPIALARLACRTCRDGDVRALLTYIDALLTIAQESAAARPDVPFAVMPGSPARDGPRGHAGGRRAVRGSVSVVT